MTQRNLVAYVSVVFMIALATCPQSTRAKPTPVANASMQSDALSNSMSIADAPWPVLPDGRLVLDIFGRRIALSPCDTCRRDIEFMIVPHRASAFLLTWGDVMQNPARLRRALSNADQASIRSANLPNMAGLLFGRFVRNAMPTSQVLTLTIYREPLRRSDCAKRDGELAVLPCDVLLKLASEPKNADPAGFALNYEHFYGGTDKNTLYVSTATTQSSAADLPSYFICNWFAVCANALNPLEGPGYLVALDVGIAFSFHQKVYPETKWLDLQRQWQSVFADMIVP